MFPARCFGLITTNKNFSVHWWQGMILLNDYYYFRVLARFVRMLMFRIMHTVEYE